jgi:hypothetical protein
MIETADDKRKGFAHRGDIGGDVSIATYSQAGAQFGYGLLWTVFLIFAFSRWTHTPEISSTSESSA